MIIAIAVVVLALAVANAVRLAVAYPKAPLADSVLSAREQALIAAAADAFFPKGGPIPVSGTEAGALRYFDGYLRRSARTQRVLLRLLFAFTELSPLVFGPRRVRFTRLRPDDQIRFMEQASASRIYFRRVALLSLRTVMTMAYLANDRVARCMRMVPDKDPFNIGERILERLPSKADSMA